MGIMGGGGSSISVPVSLKLEVLQSSLAKLQSQLDKLAPNSKRFKELQAIISEITREMDKVNLQTSKPFGDQAQFSQTEKSIDNIEESFRKVELVLNKIHFSDLKLDPSQQAELKKFTDEIERIKTQFNSFKEQKKLDLLGDVDFSDFKKYKDINIVQDMGKRSFSRRLSWRIIGIVSAIIVTMLLVVGIVSNQIIADEATRAAQHILHGTISEIERPLGHVEIITATVAAHAAPIAASAKPSDKAIHSLLQQTVRLDSLVTGCSMIVPGNKGNTTYYCFADAEGEMHSGILDTARAEARYIDAMTDAVAKKGQALWTDPHRQLGFQDARSITYCYPVYADGRLLAIITSDLSIEWMEHKIESLRPYKNSLTSILCSGGGVIGIRDTNMLAQIRKSFAEDKELASLGEDLLSGKDSLRRRIGKGRNLSFVVFGPLHNGWTLSLTCMYRDVLERVTKMQLNLLIIGFFGLLVLFFVCRLVIRRLSKPITQLSESALNMAKGDFKAELPEIKSQDEMKNLRDSFVFMQNSIADYIEELKTTTAANERMESELGVARNIQMGMLRTDFPRQLYALLNPAKEVGGDLYDYIIKDKTLYFAVGDVSGKGVPASLMMAITRAALRFVSGLNLPMNETMSRINSSVCDINSNNMFVTLFVGRIDLTTGRMEYCNAGHNPIMILPVGGKPYFLKAKPNLAVGLFEDFPYQSESIDLAAGTRIVAYTDGVNEAENADKALFGNDRLLQWAEEVDANDSEQAVVESLYDAVKAFADGNPQNDDITIMSIKL